MGCIFTYSQCNPQDTASCLIDVQLDPTISRLAPEIERTKFSVELKQENKSEGAFHSKTTHAEHQLNSEFPENLQVEVAQTPGSSCKIKNTIS